ncbi:MAG TPA: damage-inducible protein, partial [Casimicrobium sp.]|nr:damage-inducible protein [Casimicrobium sp.]
LRGNQRTLGEQSRKEGGKIFGSGSRAPIAVSILVKNLRAHEQGGIYFYDIGDYLERGEKLEKVKTLGSIAGIRDVGGWQKITPDAHGDWLNQRDDRFGDFIALGDKKGQAPKLFDNFSLGVVTNRDAWCYNHSATCLSANMRRMIAFYNAEAERFTQAHASLSRKDRAEKVDDFINTDPSQISWTRALKQELTKDQRFAFETRCLTASIYRPFTKQWLYFNRRLNEMVLLMPRIFPDASAKNFAICVTGVGAKDLSTLLVDSIPDLQMHFNGQCFPLYVYDEIDADELERSQSSLFATRSGGTHTRRDAITDAGLAHFQSVYPGEAITKEDLFYYVYGLLHSPVYRERYADNLSKELPRIPRVKTAADFCAFSKAGRELAELHLNYETVAMHAGAKIESGGKTLSDADYRVEKMKYGKRGKDKDLTTLIYNAKITVTGIPLEAYDYVVNGKPALDWVVERQCVKTDKDSG